jgi:hypothetical protein
LADKKSSSVVRIAGHDINKYYLIGGAVALGALIIIVPKIVGASGAGQGGGGIKPGSEPVPQHTVPLYSVIHGYVSSCSPFTWNSTTNAQWDALAGYCEGAFKNSQYFRGEGKYIANFSGDIFPKLPFTKGNPSNATTDQNTLASWIKGGGVYIDYCQYPFSIPDCLVWIPIIGPPNVIGEGVFSNFCNDIGIHELGWYSIFNQGSDFNAKKTYVSFPYKYSLVLRGNKPNSSIFLTSDRIASLSNVPYVQSKVYSMFAIRAGNGIYAYSHANNSAKDFATFLIAVHNRLI